MYREKPANALDNGWRFLSGEESSEDMQDAARHGVYDVNVIANYDSAIIPLLDAPLGSAFKRDWKTFRFIAQNKYAKKLRLK
jgi:hypothetical protein